MRNKCWGETRGRKWWIKKLYKNEEKTMGILEDIFSIGCYWCDKYFVQCSELNAYKKMKKYCVSGSRCFASTKKFLFKNIFTICKQSNFLYQLILKSQKRGCITCCMISLSPFQLIGPNLALRVSVRPPYQQVLSFFRANEAQI